MPSLITILGACLFAASAAVAADRPAEPWWSNPPAAASSAADPTASERPPATAADPSSQSGGLTRARRAAQAAESSSHPPGLLRPDLSTILAGDTTAAAETPGERSKSLEFLPDAARTPQAPAAAPATDPTPPATADSPAAAQDSEGSLGLGSRNGKNLPGKRSSLAAMLTTGGSLAVVLGLFLVVAWVMRKAAPRGSMVLPQEVFEVLGRAPLGPRQQVQLLRCGSKLLLVSITPAGAETLTEVTDPQEVERLAEICRQDHPQAAATAARRAIGQVAASAGEPSELDDLQPAGTHRKRYRWEETHV